MTSREIVNRLFIQNDPVRVGLTGNPWGDTLAAWVGQGYPTRKAWRKEGEQRFRLEDGKRISAEADGEHKEPGPPWEHFGYDMVGTGGWFDVMPIR